MCEACTFESWISTVHEDAEEIHNIYYPSRAFDSLLQDLCKDYIVAALDLIGQGHCLFTCTDKQ